MNQHNRSIILTQRLLMIIFDHSDNLHRSIGTFYCYQLSYRLIIGSKAQIAYGRLLNHQFIYIVSVLFWKAPSGYHLQTICLYIIRIAGQHLIKPVLLQSVIGTAIGKESSHLLARHSTGSCDTMHQWQPHYRFLHRFQLHIQPVCTSGKFND